MINKSGNNKFFELTGIDLSQAQQGSDVWYKAKLGVISASNADCLLAGKETAKRQSYLAELCGQIITKQHAELNNYHVNFGKLHEATARASFEFDTGLKVNESAFIFKDETLRCGCSSDGLIDGVDEGLELKVSSNTKHFVEFVCDEKIKPAWVLQCQFSMFVTGFDAWWFSQFEPRSSVKPLHYVKVHRNETTMQRFSDALPEFNYDLDQMLNKFGVQYTDQWKDL